MLRQKVMEKLKLKPKAMTELEKKDNIDLEVIKNYLQTAMMDDDEFTEEVKGLIEDINKDLEEAGQGSNIMYVYGGKAYQQNQNQGNIYNADTINIHGKQES